MDKIEKVVIHHSASPRSTTFEEIRQWHTRSPPEGRGWVDIAYHVIIDHTGLIHQGRAIPRNGAHARGANSDSIGICITGDNSKPEHKWSLLQQDALRQVLDAIELLWPGLPVVGHRDVMEPGHTICPGVEVATLLE